VGAHLHPRQKVNNVTNTGLFVLQVSDEEKGFVTSTPKFYSFNQSWQLGGLAVFRHSRHVPEYCKLCTSNPVNYSLTSAQCATVWTLLRAHRSSYINEQEQMFTGLTNQWLILINNPESLILNFFAMQLIQIFRVFLNVCPGWGANLGSFWFILLLSYNGSHIIWGV
jgi:hypothetical protein